MARSCSQTSTADAGSSGAGHASQAPVATAVSCSNFTWSGTIPRVARTTSSA